MPAPSWSPHPTVLRVTAYAACLVVVGMATSMVLGVLGQLALVLFPLAVALFATRALSIPAGWLRGPGLEAGAGGGRHPDQRPPAGRRARRLRRPPMIGGISDLG